MPEEKDKMPVATWITLAVLALTGLVAFSRVESQTALHARELADHEQRLRVVENAISGSLGRIDQRLTGIEKALERGGME